MKIAKISIFVIILYILFLVVTTANADFLGCFEPNEAVEIKSLFLDTTGARVDPTSPGCEVFDPDDTTATTCTSGPTKIGTIVGWYQSSHTIPVSPLAGTWYAKVNGTIASVVNEGTDTFHVVDTAGDCASRTGVVTTSGAVTSVTNGVTVASGGFPVGGFASGAITADAIAAGAITSSELSPTAGHSYCDVTASVSGTDFEVGSCYDLQGNAVTLANDSFNGLMMYAYSNGTGTCNVNGQGILVQDGVLDVANLDIVPVSTSPANSGFKAAPTSVSTNGCGMVIK